MNKEPVALSSRVRYRAVGEDGVMIHLDNGRVIVVSEVGLYIVKLLDTPKTRPQLVASIEEEFEVSTDQATIDLDLFLYELEKEQLLEIDSSLRET